MTHVTFMLAQFPSRLAHLKAFVFRNLQRPRGLALQVQAKQSPSATTVRLR